MATTSIYKNQAGRYRVMTTEDVFSSGMQYTNAPIDEGFVKALVNYDIINDGEALRPRSGLVTDTLIDGTFLTGSDNYSVHSTGLLFVKNFAGTDASLCRYALFGTTTHIIADTPTWHFDLSKCVLLLEYSVAGTQYHKAIPYTGTAGLYASCENPITSIHDTPIEILATDINKTYSTTGVNASVESNTYIPIQFADGTGYIGRVVATFSADSTTFTWTVSKLEPAEITPTQAINYGYNMLKNDPYAFTNKSTETGGIVLEGIIPKDSDGTLMLSARPGAVIFFHLIYQYPTADITAGKKYYVQWEMQDLNGNSEPAVLQQVRNSPVYTPGEPIFFRCTNTTYKQFTLIAKIYYKNIVDAQVYDPSITQELGDATYLIPDQVMTLASYSLTNDNNTSTLNMATVNYDLNTAKGICSWQQRLVMWGVHGAKSTLFISEINKPEYVPYPNNSEIFSDNIVACLPYLSQLLVFTYNKLYLLTINMDGLSYTVKCIQDRLSMTDDDASTVKAVQNMVYFKSGNYFYLIVPKTTSTTGELQIAPITTPIEFLFNNFMSSIQAILNDVYNLDVIYGIDGLRGTTTELHLSDYCNYLENKQMRNVYKFLLTMTKEDATYNYFYIDVVLQYDTTVRAWTCYTYQSTAARLIPYESTVTGNSRFLSLYKVGADVHPEIITTDVIRTVDTFKLDNNEVRTLQNTQFLDTGYRKHVEQIKKRYREIQFTVNNTDQAELAFHTGFVVDDDTRKALYTYTVTPCTDLESAGYGMIIVEREPSEPYEIADNTKLGSWVLDFSKFPSLYVVKVRHLVSGKGYGGSIKILCNSGHMYELLNITWVYRTLYAR